MSAGSPNPELRRVLTFLLPVLLGLVMLGVVQMANAAYRPDHTVGAAGAKDRSNRGHDAGRTTRKESVRKSPVGIGSAVAVVRGTRSSSKSSSSSSGKSNGTNGKSSEPTKTSSTAPVATKEETSSVTEAASGGSALTGSSVYLGATVAASVFGETENPPWNMKPLERFEADSGHKVQILQVHQEWGNVEASVLQKIRARGTVPMLILEYNTLSQITNGSQDSKIKAMSNSIASYGGPVLLRWDWEMNGDWYPWGGQARAAEWVAAYRHLHDVLAAPNVSWIWNPNIYYPNVPAGAGVPVNPSAWWPGSEYVDWMGADGYSYGTESFPTVFGPTYELFQKLAPEKPIILPEWAASNSSGRKAGYIKEAFEDVPSRFPAIKAMVYYNDTLGDGGDWPLEELPAAEAAYKAGASSSTFTTAPSLTAKLSIP